MAAVNEIREASARFYAALNRMACGTVGTMDPVWSHSADTTAMHPIDGREVGWDNVKRSFDQFAQIATAGHVALKDQWIRVLGDVAYEVIPGFLARVPPPAGNSTRTAGVRPAKGSAQGASALGEETALLADILLGKAR